MTPANIIEFFGGISAAARALGCKPQTIHDWIENGEVPEGRQYQAELATGGRLRAAKPALRTEPAKVA